MFKNAEEIRQAVDAGKTVYWKGTQYTVHKAISGYYIYCKFNKNEIGLTHEDGKTLNGELWDFYTDEDVAHGLEVFYAKQIEMMKDELSFVRAKLQEKEGIPSRKIWLDYPKSYIK